MKKERRKQESSVIKNIVVYYEWMSRDNVTYRIAVDISKNAAPRRNPKYLESGQPFLLSRAFSFDISLEASVRSPRQLMNIPLLANKIPEILRD